MLHIATCKISHVASITGVNNVHNCNINCKALERIIVGMKMNGCSTKIEAKTCNCLL